MSDHIKATDESAPTSLSEALTTKQTNGQYAALFIDQVGSLAGKINRPTASWMSDLEFIYRTVEGIVRELLPDAVVKFEGDGVIIVVSSTKTADLINVAVRVMEALDQAANKKLGHYTGQNTIQMRAGIATGEMLRFIPPMGGVDHIGPAMDVAARLCSVASPKAILVDDNSIETANMGQVRSHVGEWRNRTPAQYRGDQQMVRVKGIPDPLAYYEILWDENAFGLQSAAVTESTTKPPTPPATPSSPPKAADNPKGFGKIKTWLNDKGFGFITDAAGEDFYISRKSLVYAEDIEMLVPGREVSFAIAPALQEGRARRAVSVLVVGSDAEGKLVFRHATKPFGFISVVDSFGSAISVHVAIPEDSDWKVGTELTFTVQGDSRGPRAVDVEITDADDDSRGGSLSAVA